MQWDVFCHVVDNFGDIGFCWRLAADLGARGQRVRLWVDDPSALEWMAPRGAPGVEVHAWTAGTAWPEPGGVVVEVFGCTMPEAFVARMQRARPPAWINLEYLSAEPYVDRCHGLPSPQLQGAGAGLTKWFFFPGFTERTGGLVHETDLDERQRRFDRDGWLRHHGLALQPGERLASLFCYDNPQLPALLQLLAEAPTLLLLTPGTATREGLARLGPALRQGRLRAHPMPWLEQRDYDELLWAADLNFVRGEDSFVRAQWAGRPFVWMIYPQQDGAHGPKLEAFLNRHLEDAGPELSGPVRQLWRAWNGLGEWTGELPPGGPWQAHATRWREQIGRREPLGARLVDYAAGLRAGTPPTLPA